MLARLVNHLDLQIFFLIFSIGDKAGTIGAAGVILINGKSFEVTIEFQLRAFNNFGSIILFYLYSGFVKADLRDFDFHCYHHLTIPEYHTLQQFHFPSDEIRST